MSIMIRIFFLLSSIFFIPNGTIQLACAANPPSNINPKTGTKKPPESLPIPNWMVSSENFPGSIKAFEENKGQYNNPVNDGKVLYGCRYKGVTILFTERGPIYFMKEVVKKDSSEEEEEEQEEKQKTQKEQEEEWKNMKALFHHVTIEWQNSNLHPEIEAIEETPFYFNTSNADDPKISLDHIHAFRKLIYHDVYPGTDVVFEFHKDQGVKYSVLIKAGYTAVNFEMKYSGQKNLKLTNKGDLHIQTPMGDIIDHCPVSMQKGQTITSSFLKIGDDKIRFKIDKMNASADLLIDPWTVFPITQNFVPNNICADANGNVYIMGAASPPTGGTHSVQKYSAAGILQWTYLCNDYGNRLSTNVVSDMAVDPAGNCYISIPFPGTNLNNRCYGIICLNTTGVKKYYYAAYNSDEITETWNLAYSCDYSQVVQAGCGKEAKNILQIAMMNPTNGTVGPVNQNNVLIGEIYAGVIAPNGFYYALTADSSMAGAPTQGKFNNLVRYSIAGNTTTFSWKRNVGYDLSDWTIKMPNAISSNGIGASCSYVYTSNGEFLDQHNLATGALIKRVNIPGGVSRFFQNSGIAVDLICGNVYVGGLNTVHVFDANLNPIGSFPGLPGTVYDVVLKNGMVTACGANKTTNAGFVTQFSALKCPDIITMTHTNAGCGNSGTATVTPTFCSGPYTYIWTPTGQTTQTATNLPPGLYTVKISTGGGCVTSQDTVTIFGSGGGLTFTITQTNIGCDGGNTGSATVSGLTGTAPYIYNWAPSGGTGATATGLAAGTYTVNVKDANGCVGTKTVTITQSSSLKDSIVMIPVSCGGGNDGTAIAIPSNGTLPYTYAWSPSGGNADTAKNLSAGTYTVIIKDSKGCSIISTATITEPSSIVLTTASTAAQCGASDGSVTVTASGGSGPYSYTWSPVSGNGSTLSNLGAGSYTVTVTDKNGCVKTAIEVIRNTGALVVTTAATNVNCKGGADGTATITASGGTAPYIYVWNTIPVQNTATATGLKAGTYTVLVTASDGCKAPATVTITEPIGISLTTDSTNETCGKGNGTATVTASGGAGSFTYQWNNGQTTATAINLKAGTYTVTVKDANGCSITATLSLSSSPGPVANFSVANACVNSSVLFTNTSKKDSFWNWSFGDNSSAILKNPAHVYSTAGTYSVKLVISDSLGCLDSISKPVTIHPSPKVSFGDSISGCSPLNVSFTNNSDPGSYLWDLGDNTTSTLQLPKNQYLNNTQYPVNYTIKLQVTSVNGCRSTLSIPKLVTVYPNAKAIFTMNPSVTDIMAPGIKFYNQSPGGIPALWTFGDGEQDNSRIANPVHVYKDTGTYTVCLKVINDYNCPDSTCNKVIIKPLWSFYVPNAFTPNGDGRNDTFNGSGTGIKEYEMLIFDRWGDQLFKSTSLSDSWDGRANNGADAVQQDVYVYRIVLKDIFYKEHRYIGTVTVVK
jgi:gliding motility-associated-like protein